MLNRSLADAIELARTLGPMHDDLLERVHAVGQSFGIEVLDLRALSGGVWEVRLRPGTGPGRVNAPDAPVEAVPIGEPAFVSPIREVVPFTGDGSPDILRFIAEGDQRALLPPRGVRRGTILTLAPGNRLRMLASTIVGDAVLSLQHLGQQDDGAALDAALRNGRRLYAAELDRAAVGDTAPLLAEYDLIASALPHELLSTC